MEMVIAQIQQEQEQRTAKTEEARPVHAVLGRGPRGPASRAYCPPLPIVRPEPEAQEPARVSGPLPRVRPSLKRMKQLASVVRPPPLLQNRSADATFSSRIPRSLSPPRWRNEADANFPTKSQHTGQSEKELTRPTAWW